MPTPKSTRQSRRVRFTKTFIARSLSGKEGPGPWTDEDSPLRLKRTAKAGQYYTEKKDKGAKRTITPKATDGSALKNTAALWTLEEARAWAKGVVVDLARGVDPVAKRKPVSSLFRTLAEEYRESYAKGHTPASTKAEGYGVKYANAVIGDRPAREIGPADASALKDRYSESPSNARKAWGSAQRVMDIAVERGLTDVNVFRAMRPPKPPRAKSRHPGLTELAAIERACIETQGVGSEIVRFAMRLPLRVDAISSLVWSEVDLERADLLLRTGHGRKFQDEQRLPLPALAAELLTARRPAKPDPESLVFASDVTGGKFSGWNHLYARLRKRSGVSAWSPHDFRRSAVSLVAEHRPDISEESLDRLLTHAQSSTIGGVKGVYQRAKGFEGMRQAADAWDTLLRGALAGNVVHLQQRMVG